MIIQSVIDEEAKGDSAKHVFISGQTTHITIEEEHPGGEDLNSDSPTEDDDFDVDVQTLPSAKHGNAVEFLADWHDNVIVVRPSVCDAVHLWPNDTSYSKSV